MKKIMMVIGFAVVIVHIQNLLGTQREGQAPQRTMAEFETELAARPERQLGRITAAAIADYALKNQKKLQLIEMLQNQIHAINHYRDAGNVAERQAYDAILSALTPSLRQDAERKFYVIRELKEQYVEFLRYWFEQFIDLAAGGLTQEQADALSQRLQADLTTRFEQVLRAGADLRAKTIYEKSNLQSLLRALVLVGSQGVTLEDLNINAQYLKDNILALLAMPWDTIFGAYSVYALPDTLQRVINEID